ncbi:MAG TPA: PspC domain-containing protein [Alteraurantiacibacter sp.]|jgi:phage shock protein PspC (stress-responsive transcriptional regulator)
MSNIDRRNHGTDLSGSFRLDKVNGKLMGVCAGLANYFKVDPMIVRAVFVIGTLVGFGSFILIYLAIALLAD